MLDSISYPPESFQILWQEKYGEPFDHGWGIDIPGFGASLNFTGIQAHTLKPASVGNSDGHMKYEEVGEGIIGSEGLIRFTEDGAGRCLTARSAAVNTSLEAIHCSERNKLQLWSIAVNEWMRKNTFS